MPRVNFANIIESKAGGAQIEPGNYACAIVSAEDVPARQYVMLNMRVTQDGPAKGHEFKSYLSYGEKALPMTKARLMRVSESNPGFDACAAFEADQWGWFCNKAVGVTFDEEEWRGNDGTVRNGAHANGFLAIRDLPTAKAPRHKRLDGTWCSIEDANAEKAKAQAQAAPAYAAESIPF